jgi:thiamine transport system substrate-binding protein
LVSAEFQEQLPLTNFVYPVRDDVALPDVFAAYSPRPDDPLRLDPATVAANRETWIDAWTSTVLR